MNMYGVVVGLGLLNMLLALWARRQGSPYWRRRLFLGLLVTLGGLYLLWTAR